MDLMLDGDEAWQIKFGYLIRIDFRGDRALSIAAPIEITSPDGTLTTGAPTRLSLEGALVIRQLRDTVLRASTTDTGRLTVEWASGSKWTVRPRSDRDSWSASPTEEGLLIVAGPGGHLRASDEVVREAKRGGSGVAVSRSDETAPGEPEKLRVDGHLVTSIEFVYNVTLHFDNRRTITIGCPVHISDPAGRTVLVDPEDSADHRPLFLQQLHQRVTTAVVNEDGGLYVSWADGSQWRVKPDERYEAWQATGMESPTLIISGPGGELVVWDEPMPWDR